MRRLLCLAGFLLAATACSDGGSARPPTTTSGPAPTTAAATTTPATNGATTTGAGPTTTTGAGLTTTTGGPLRLRLARVADADRPLGLAVRPGDDALYIVEKGGTVRALRAGAGLAAEPVLDISGEVSSGSEQGLLGLAFSPDGTALYINYTDTASDTRIEEWALAGGRADPATRRELLRLGQPFANHNGGSVVVGPNDLLYLGLGDGGSAGDPQGNGQDPGTLLGTILRIDPGPSGSAPYTIPPDNPFAEGGGRPEVWAFGLRNPWRFSFDRETGDLWIGDVGQNAWEEVDRVGPGQGRGANFGWNLLEGSHPFAADAAPGTVLPVYEYENGAGACSVTGGYVYRGERIPALRGAYVFGDYCGGVVEVLRPAAGGGFEHEALDLAAPSISSFGEDAAGEIYVLDLEGGVYRLEPA